MATRPPSKGSTRFQGWCTWGVNSPVKPLLLDVIIWNLLPSAAFTANGTSESTEQLMSINASVRSNLLNGILKCAPNFGA